MHLCIHAFEYLCIPLIIPSPPSLSSLPPSLPPPLLPSKPGKIRLCVIDSMSALFRGEFNLSKGDTLERAKIIFAMAKQMKTLSDKFKLPFVVTNQVTADFQAGQAGQGGVEGGMEGGGVQPALGLSWSNCVHSRYLLTRRDRNNAWPVSSLPPSLPPSAATTMAETGERNGSSSSSSSSTSQWVRQMRLLLSPSLPPNLSCQFVVETAGVRGVGRRGVGLEEEG